MSVSFRVTVTTLVVAMVITLAAVLIVLQFRIFTIAAQSSASDSMAAMTDRVSANLNTRLANTVRLVHFLAAVAEVADEDSPGVNSHAADLFRVVLEQVAGLDSVYVGYDSGHWLQVLRASSLTGIQRQKLQVPPGTGFLINLVDPVPGQPLPLKRLFVDLAGTPVGEIDIPRFGYDARARPWFHAAMTQEGGSISPPYLSFSSGAPMITVSMRLNGQVSGVVALDIRMDQFSAFVAEQGTAGDSIAIVYTGDGTLLAHPYYDALLARTSGRTVALPTLADLGEGIVADAVARPDVDTGAIGRVRDRLGQTYLFSQKQLQVPEIPGAGILVLTNADNFAGDIRDLQRQGLLFACIIGALFIPVAWLAASHVSRQLQKITAQAVQLQTMQPPSSRPVSSLIREVRDLGQAVDLAQRAIWSFSKFVPVELVRRLLAEKLSTELGGVRREITVVFTDVENFTSVAEGADPQVLMKQTSRYFSALTAAFLAEKGTVDKFIGDAVMVFWNAPTRQKNHVERACRAVLAARIASEAINDEFDREGLPRFRTRFGVHVGPAVVGNLGSQERMNYTALGNTVNLAARLEALNKEFGTQILVSDAVRQRVGDKFQFRKVDRIRAKGMSKLTTVYELVA